MEETTNLLGYIEMSKKDEALKMAIDFMGTLTIDVGIKTWNEKHRKEAIQACKKALEQPTQEPFAYAYIRNDNKAGLLVWEKRSYIKDLDETPVDPTPEFIQDAFRAASNSPSYPVTAGTPELREAITYWAKS